MTKEALTIFVNFIIKIISHPSAVDIFIRIILVNYIATGFRNCVRWIKILLLIKVEGKKLTHEAKERIDSKVKGYLIPTTLIVSIFFSWKYRSDFIPFGVIYENGVQVKKYMLVTLEIEHIIGEGILFGFGAVGFLLTLKVINGIWPWLLDRAMLNIFKKRSK